MNLGTEASDIKIRPARLADVPALFDMLQRFGVDLGTEAGLTATAADWARDGFGDNPRFSAVVAEDASALFGMATWSEFYFTDLGRTIYFIHQLYVDPARRRNGIGRCLLAYVAAAAARNRVPIIELGVVNNASAKSLYRRVGFRRAVGYSTYILFGTALAEAAASASDLLNLMG
jgi:GNAT superfamily N-acetyltransferase